MFSEEKVNKLRECYKKGCRIELVYTDDPYTKLVPGDKGTVKCVDDAGQIHISWDNGSSLAMIPEIDKIKKI